jgi:hypothetical protein
MIVGVYGFKFTTLMGRSFGAGLLLLSALAPLVRAQETAVPVPQNAPPLSSAQAGQVPPATPTDTVWQYGGFADIGYLEDFNDPPNHLFRSRGTTFHVNEVDLNMAALYLRKAA